MLVIAGGVSVCRCVGVWDRSDGCSGLIGMYLLDNTAAVATLTLQFDWR